MLFNNKRKRKKKRPMHKQLEQTNTIKEDKKEIESKLKRAIKSFVVTSLLNATAGSALVIALLLFLK